MAKETKQNLDAFIEYLKHLVQITPRQPFTTEQIWQILHRWGMPKDLSKYRNENLVPLMKEIHKQKHDRAEANFRDPSRMRSLGEVLHSHLVISHLYISQLAEKLDMTAEDIEAYIENRQPAQSMNEVHLMKLAEVTGIALKEINRIAAETMKSMKQDTRSAHKVKPDTAPRTPYSIRPIQSGMLRDKREDYNSD